MEMILEQKTNNLVNAVHPEYGVANSVLVDNSTYFSTKSAINESEIDATSLFNLSGFLEAIVFSDKVFLCPTLAWQPDNSDELFKDDGPCMTVDCRSWSEELTSFILSSALNNGMRDVKNRRKYLPFKDAKASKVLKNLEKWNEAANNDPLGLLEQYSGVVSFTDSNSLKILNQIQYPVKYGNESRQLAQYLFRTNVAHVLSQHAPYQPHSHRATLISQKASAEHKNFSCLAISLLKTVEKEIATNFDSPQLADFLGPIQHLEADIPLTLSVVLSNVSRPEEIIPFATSLRSNRAVVRYRNWVAKVMKSIVKGNPKKRIRAEKELADAIVDLSAEMGRIYGSKRREVSKEKGILASTDYNDLGENKYLNLVKELFGAGSKVVNKFLKRRKYSVLLRFAKSREQINQLNDLLPIAFRQKLNDEELKKFFKLVRSQRKDLHLISTVKKKPSTSKKKLT